MSDIWFTHWIDLLLLDCGRWMPKAIEHYKHLSIYSLRWFYYLCRPIYYFIMEMFWLITKEQERSITKESIQKVFIALRWNVIQNEEVHVYCIQKSSSRVFVQLCTISRLWLSSLVYKPSSIHDKVWRMSCFCVCVCGRDPSAWLMFISRVISVFWNDVNVLRAALLSGHPPAAHMLTTFPLLLRVRRLFLQLLSLVFGPSVLEPDFHLNKSDKERPF